MTIGVLWCWLAVGFSFWRAASRRTVLTLAHGASIGIRCAGTARCSWCPGDHRDLARPSASGVLVSLAAISSVGGTSSSLAPACLRADSARGCDRRSTALSRLSTAAIAAVQAQAAPATCSPLRASDTAAAGRRASTRRPPGRGRGPRRDAAGNRTLRLRGRCPVPAQGKRGQRWRSAERPWRAARDARRTAAARRTATWKKTRSAREPLDSER